MLADNNEKEREFVHMEERDDISELKKIVLIKKI